MADLRQTARSVAQATLLPDYQCLVNGQLVAADHTFAVLNPATGEQIASAPNADAALVQTAVDAAASAFPAWAPRLLPSALRCCGVWPP